MATSNLGYQSFYQTTLSSNISNTDLTIPLTTLPTPSEGFLVLESTITAKREIIYYTSKTASAVVCPADGRGYDGTTAVAHLSGADVIMAPVAAMFETMRDLFETTPQGWTPVTQTVSSVSANGNRSYDVTFNSSVAATMSPGMRLRTTRTVAAPTQCTSLNGTNQYYNKTSPAGMTFTDDFVVSAWVKVNAYPAVQSDIVSRYNGTSGWTLIITNTGQVNLGGLNSGAANYASVTSYQSIPLNKWVHITAQLDMSTAGTSTTTSYVMIDGIDVPSFKNSAGTNPTSLIQAGNLEIGSENGGLRPFNGKIAQVAIYSAKVTQANIRATISQGLTGSETSLISAYSFNNSITDLNTTNANNLTAQNSAVATNADSPFGYQADGTISSTLDYAIITKVASAVATVQVPEGCTIPTTGGVTSVSYSTQKVPYGFPSEGDKWKILSFQNVQETVGIGSIAAWYQSNFKLTVPVGKWTLGIQANVAFNSTVSGVREGDIILSSSSELPSTSNGTYIDSLRHHMYAATGNYVMARYVAQKNIDLSTATSYTLYGAVQSATGSESWYTNRGNEIYAECTYL